jgi:DNA-binding winged helix-turn-helix (wHTH) protein/tetratricopeptide (TPR) repeat protein
MPQPAQPTYLFGPFRLDVALSRLERDGAPVPLPPKAFDLLVLLARNSQRVVSKQELIETLWPDSYVEEANLTQHIYTLRKALGDQAGGRPYIDTVPKRGYRLAGDVREAGAPVAAATDARTNPPAPAAPADDARRFVTVLHCALADAAGIVERDGSVALQDVVRRLYDIADAEVARYQGVVAERHPDGFVAFFGADAAHEDDATRAVLAALAIGRRAAELTVDLRVGIGAGSLVVTRTAAAPASYSAVGDALRRADLLAQFAPPGSILVSEGTLRAIERHFAAEEVTPAPPGHRAFRVVGPLRKMAGVRPSRRSFAPFIGRQHESSLLQRLAERALEGKGQAVSIVGEPGMGKSRLVYEFTESIDRGKRDVMALEGRCVAYGSLVPYLPLVDLLRAHCAVDDTDPPELIRQAIATAVRENGLHPDASGWLLRLMGIVDVTTAAETVSPEAIKARTFDVLRTLFLKAALKHPLIIVVEDLHWIDPTSEEFLLTLIERLVGARVMLLATHRPGYRTPWIDRSYVTQITLSPLAAADSAQLVESIAPAAAIGERVSGAILSRGEGNPFFLEELARSVSERGAAAEAIPETIQGVITARLDRLSAAAKQLLQTASVLGREVVVRELAELARKIDLEDPLRELCQEEFLYERAGGDAPVFVFKHALTQDVAYDSLLSRRRRELHLTAARVLENVYPDRLEEMTATIAYHYARTDLVEEAVTWLVRAAERAARAYANAEAILHLDLAARRVQRLPEGPARDRRMLDVALGQAHSLYFLGRFRESVDVLAPHAAPVARLNDPGLAARYSFWLAHMYSRLGDQRRAAESAHRAIDAAERAGDRATLGKAHGLLALEGHWSGNTGDGIAHGETAISLLRPLPEQRWWLGMAYFYLAVNHLLMRDFEHAVAAATQVDGVGREIGDPRLQTYAGYTLGWIELTRGNAEIAVAVCRKSLQTAPDRVSRTYASLFLSFALIEHGNHGEAGELLGDTLKELEQFAFPQWHSLAVILMGEVRRRTRCLEEAARLISQGREIAARANYRYAMTLADQFAARVAHDENQGAVAP